MRNYKPILVDRTGWIYLDLVQVTSKHSEKFDVSRDNESRLSRAARRSCALTCQCLLKRITIESFNLVGELLRIGVSANECRDDTADIKCICYVQADLNVSCSIDYATPVGVENSMTFPAEDTESRLSLLKTRELCKALVVANYNCPRQTKETSLQINDTLDRDSIDDDAERLSGERTDAQCETPASVLSELARCLYADTSGTHHNYYIFKVVHLGVVYSLTNSQYRSKLRADATIELAALERGHQQSQSK